MNLYKIRAVLEQAGWFPGRHVNDLADAWIRKLESEGFKCSGNARRTLAEFGGIRVRQSGPGESVALASFSFDPLAASGERDNIERYERGFGSSLFPIGEAENGAGLRRRSG